MALSLFPVLPVIWISVKMHHRKNKHPVIFNAVEHAIGESADKTAMDIIFHIWSSYWMG